MLLILSGFLPKPIPVEMGVVSRGPLIVTVMEEGKTRIRHRYMVSPPVAGYLERVPLRAAAPIVANETVVATLKANSASFLDPRAKAQAEAALKSSDAAVSQRQAQLETARTELELAIKELARADKLKTSGAIALSEWDTTSNRASVLKRQLNTAEFALNVAQFERTQTEAALLQSTAPDGGEPVKILAPVTGTILNVIEENARPVTAGTQIMEVGDTKDIEAEIELLSSDAVNVKVGAEVSIEQWGGRETLKGRVSVVEPGGYTKFSALGVEEQRVKVRVDFLDLPEGVLGDRYRVEARIVTWQGDHILQVPTGALFRRGNDWMTFLIENGKATSTKVEIAHNNGISAEVISGLTEGQRVILHPPDSVTEGARVTPRK